MSEPIHDPDAYRREIERQDACDAIRPDGGQPDAEARPCPAPVRPGMHNANAARRLGCEDEWVDRMKNRYGGEW
jgi:hypothetical protein